MSLNRSEVSALLEVGIMTNPNSGPLKSIIDEMEGIASDLMACANGDYDCEFDAEAQELMLNTVRSVRESIAEYASVGGRVNDSCERLRQMLEGAQSAQRSGAELAAEAARKGSSSLQGVSGGVRKG